MLWPATEHDAVAIAAMRTAAGDRLTRDCGRGPWSGGVTERSVLVSLRAGQLFVARREGRIMASLRLTTKKPWAIDRRWFSEVPRPLYLVEMVVDPQFQRQGVGRRCLGDAECLARAFLADAIRLDAYDGAGGAGPFYARCGYEERGRAMYRSVPLIYYERLLYTRAAEAPANVS